MHPEGKVHPSLFALGLLLCIVCLTYANGLWGVFQFDDFNVIVNNARVHSWSAWWQDVHHGIRPVLKLTYTFDWTLGLGVYGFHLGNIFIHLLNTCLVWALSCRVVANSPLLKEHSLLPLLAALLFAVHPVQTEAVTYICGRSAALMTLFYLSGLWAYSAGRQQGNAYYLHLLTPLAMLLALGTKETAVTFPFALLLWELYNGGSARTAARYQWSSWLLLLVSGVFFLYHEGYSAELATSAGLNNLSGNFATQTLAFAYLMRQWFMPLWLNIDPDLRVVHSYAGLLPQIGVLCAVIALTVLTRRRRPWLSFALAWAVLQLFPLYIVLPRLDVANDRQLYLASWPLALALVAELSCWLQPRVFRLVVLSLLAVLVCLSMLRNQDYQSEIALWQATVKLSPDKARVQNNLGYALMLDGNIPQARAAFTTALQLDPGYYQARYNLLTLKEKTGETVR